MRKVGRVGVFCFLFFGLCIMYRDRGRWGRIGRGGRDEAKRREREERVKERIFLLF